MEIVLTEKEFEKLHSVDKVIIKKGKFNKCYFCIGICRFLKDTVFSEIDRREYCICSGCDKNVNVAFI